MGPNIKQIIAIDIPIAAMAAGIVYAPVASCMVPMKNGPAARPNNIQLVSDPEIAPMCLIPKAEAAAIGTNVLNAVAAIPSGIGHNKNTHFGMSRVLTVKSSRGAIVAPAVENERIRLMGILSLR